MNSTIQIAVGILIVVLALVVAVYAWNRDTIDKMREDPGWVVTKITGNNTMKTKREFASITENEKQTADSAYLPLSKNKFGGTEMTYEFLVSCEREEITENTSDAAMNAVHELITRGARKKFHSNAQARNDFYLKCPRIYLSGGNGYLGIEFNTIDVKTDGTQSEYRDTGNRYGATETISGPMISRASGQLKPVLKFENANRKNLVIRLPPSVFNTKPNAGEPGNEDDIRRWMHICVSIRDSSWNESAFKLRDKARCTVYLNGVEIADIFVDNQDNLSAKDYNPGQGHPRSMILPNTGNLFLLDNADQSDTLMLGNVIYRNWALPPNEVVSSFRSSMKEMGLTYNNFETFDWVDPTGETPMRGRVWLAGEIINNLTNLNINA